MNPPPRTLGVRSALTGLVGLMLTLAACTDRGLSTVVPYPVVAAAGVGLLVCAHVLHRHGTRTAPPCHDEQSAPVPLRPLERPER